VALPWLPAAARTDFSELAALLELYRISS
jgi:hypothetical protein